MLFEALNEIIFISWTVTRQTTKHDELGAPTYLKVNSPVEVTIQLKKHCGIIKWIGDIPEMNCEMAGIELVLMIKLNK